MRTRGRHHKRELAAITFHIGKRWKEALLIMKMITVLAQAKELNNGTR